MVFFVLTGGLFEPRNPDSILRWRAIWLPGFRNMLPYRFFFASCSAVATLSLFVRLTRIGRLDDLSLLCAAAIPAWLGMMLLVSMEVSIAFWPCWRRPPYVVTHSQPGDPRRGLQPIHVLHHRYPRYSSRYRSRRPCCRFDRTVPVSTFRYLRSMVPPCTTSVAARYLPAPSGSRFEVYIVLLLKPFRLPVIATQSANRFG